MQKMLKYDRVTEPQKAQKAQIWKTAIGLQAVDGLKTSEYLIDVARQHIEGDITIDEARLAALRAAIDEGDASGDVFDFDMETFLLELKAQGR